MIPKFLTVADGIMDVASRSSMGILVIFFVRDGGPVFKISVLVRFKLRKLQFSQVFNSLIHEDSAVVW